MYSGGPKSAFARWLDGAIPRVQHLNDMHEIRTMMELNCAPWHYTGHPAWLVFVDHVGQALVSGGRK
jgi:hypothetical protein